MRHVVVGIDGTGSHEWRRQDGMNSSVHRFVHDVRSDGSLKRYWHGPDALGARMDSLVDVAFSWIRDVMVEREVLHTERQAQSRFIPPERVVPAAQEPTDYAIVLVGHSRGGWAVVRLARRLMTLNLPVRFMGLYDAVDRTTSDGWSIGRIWNVALTYHAVRAPSMNSRDSFGNTALESADERQWRVVRRPFYTSHGGVGGDPLPTQHPGLFGDTTCWRSPILMVDDWSGARHHRGATEEQVGLCIAESLAADRWIRSGASSCGVEFG